jgi:acyl-CoA thioester hydrolase
MPHSTVRSTTEIEVRYAETDQMGVVHHANYLVWFELARTRLCTLSGFHYQQIEDLGYHLMVTACQVDYRRGARYGDTITIDAWLAELASRRLRFAYEVRRAGELLATGMTEHVWVEAASGRLCRTPEPLREPFARLAAPSTRAQS